MERMVAFMNAEFACAEPVDVGVDGKVAARIVDPARAMHWFACVGGVGSVVELVSAMAAVRGEGVLLLLPPGTRAGWSFFLSDKRIVGALGGGPIGDFTSWSAAFDRLHGPPGEGERREAGFLTEATLGALVECEVPGARLWLAAGDDIVWAQKVHPVSASPTVQQIVLEYARRQDEREKLLRQVGSVDRILVPVSEPAERGRVTSPSGAPDFRRDPDAAALAEWTDVRQLWGLCDGTSSVVRVVELALLGEFRGMSAIAELLARGHVAAVEGLGADVGCADVLADALADSGVANESGYGHGEPDDGEAEVETTVEAQVQDVGESDCRFLEAVSQRPDPEPQPGAAGGVRVGSLLGRGVALVGVVAAAAGVYLVAGGASTSPARVGMGQADVVDPIHVRRRDDARSDSDGVASQKTAVLPAVEAVEVVEAVPVEAVTSGSTDSEPSTPGGDAVASGENAHPPVAKRSTKKKRRARPRRSRSRRTSDARNGRGVPPEVTVDPAADPAHEVGSAPVESADQSGTAAGSGAGAVRPLPSDARFVGLGGSETDGAASDDEPEQPDAESEQPDAGSEHPEAAPEAAPDPNNKAFGVPATRPADPHGARP